MNVKLFYFSFIGFLLLPHVSSATVSPKVESTLTVEKAVHFLMADGSDVIIQPGIYQVEAADTWLRLIPGERRDALLLKAMRTQHEEDLTVAKAMSQSGEDEEYRIVLLLPGGKGLEAIGSVSGVRSRAVRRPPTSRTRTQQHQVPRLPTQSKNNPVRKKSKPLPQSPAQPNDPLVQRIHTLEQHISSLQTLVNSLQGRLNTMASAIQVDNAGHVTIGQVGTVTLQGSLIKFLAPLINAQAATSKFTGVVQADTMITNSVVSSSYTPGAGNIW